jgi:hypothetical protein
MTAARCSLGIVLFVTASLSAADPVPANDKIKEVAGTAEFLRSVPKHFATLKAVDVANHRVTLLLDGEALPKVWLMAPDAEVRVAGWWGRLDQLILGDRVWVWFQTDRKKQAIAVAMIADELSEQDIHGPGVKVAAVSATSITFHPFKGGPRTLPLKGTVSVAAGTSAYVQSSGNQARLVLDPPAFEAGRAAQKALLRKRWTEEGLPSTVVFLHRFSGEMDLMLDHEAMRWGRSLKLGDKVTLSAKPPIPAVVKTVRPWRERTELRLVVNSFDQTDLSLGQRIHLKMTPPPPEVDRALLPPDLDQPRSKPERIEWFLASIYCPCKVKGDNCTGDFYTLASCNPNGCGMPNQLRKVIAAKIDKGLTDKQIFEELLAENGPDLVRSHLLP